MNNYTTLDAMGDIVVIYVIVILVSMLVAVVIRGIAWGLSRQVQSEDKKPATPAAPKPAADTQIPQEHLVVIAAAIAAATSSHRIVRIETPGLGHGWTSSARAAHHSSHTPRRR